MSATDESFEERVRERAYSLWETEGQPEGRAEEFWERACALIEAEDAPDAPSMIHPPAV